MVRRVRERGTRRARVVKITMGQTMDIILTCQTPREVIAVAKALGTAFAEDVSDMTVNELIAIQLGNYCYAVGYYYWHGEPQIAMISQARELFAQEMSAG